MSDIPEACIEYAKVFNTIKVEHGVSMLFGLMIGYWLQMLKAREVKP